MPIASNAAAESDGEDISAGTRARGSSPALRSVYMLNEEPEPPETTHILDPIRVATASNASSEARPMQAEAHIDGPMRDVNCMHGAMLRSSIDAPQLGATQAMRFR